MRACYIIFRLFLFITDHARDTSRVGTVRVVVVCARKAPVAHVTAVDDALIPVRLKVAACSATRRTAFVGAVWPLLGAGARSHGWLFNRAFQGEQR